MLLMLSATASSTPLNPEYTPEPNNTICNNFAFHRDENRPKNKKDSVTGLIVFRHFFGHNKSKTIVTIGGFIVGKDFSFHNRYHEQCFTN